jgi:hypothetical protein
MSLEEELADALRYRCELLVGVATACLAAANTDFGSEGWSPYPPSEALVTLREASSDLAAAEALTAAILTRVGVSWDVLASRQNLTRQSLHRRLAAEAQKMYQLAHDYPVRDLSFEIGLLRRFASAPWIRNLEATPATVAALLMSVRNTPRWWERRRTDV